VAGGGAGGGNLSGGGGAGGVVYNSSVNRFKFIKNGISDKNGRCFSCF
jgi:hypothetical protein